MRADQHHMLRTAGFFVHAAFLAVAAQHQLTVDTLVQRAIGRDLPGAPDELVAKVDAAVADLPVVMLAQARDGRAVLGDVRLPRPLPADAKAENRELHAIAEADYDKAVARWWEAMRPVLAAEWPPPQSYAPPPAPIVVVEDGKVVAEIDPADVLQTDGGDDLDEVVIAPEDVLPAPPA